MRFAYRFFLFLLTFSALIFQSSLALAGWIADTTPPLCPVSFNPPSPQQVNTTITITQTGSDPSGIYSMQLDGISSTGEPIAGLPKPVSGSVLTFTWTPTIQGLYNFTVPTTTATDKAGNINDTCIAVPFTVRPPISPWIQAVGDVHSNGRINTPGGP